MLIRDILFRFRARQKGYSQVWNTLKVIDHWKAQWRTQGGRGPDRPVPPVLNFYFLQKRSLLAKISIKRVRNLSQNAGNGHFKDSNFSKFLGGGGGACPWCLPFWKSWIHPWRAIRISWTSRDLPIIACIENIFCSSLQFSKAQVVFRVFLFHILPVSRASTTRTSGNTGTTKFGGFTNLRKTIYITVVIILCRNKMATECEVF